MSKGRRGYDGVVAALPVTIPYERYSTHAAHWWLGRALYPAAFPEDLRAEARAFYTLAYHRPPDDRQLDVLLGAPRRSSP